MEGLSTAPVRGRPLGVDVECAVAVGPAGVPHVRRLRVDPAAGARIGPETDGRAAEAARSCAGSAVEDRTGRHAPTGHRLGLKTPCAEAATWE
ncbi:hypothetical protein ROJ8625_03406 [Roseivivax jejudonensis]|uniref:Uncharacterized protein n=1 Tax=Roseivivax jejudonensis TaxID=1529041 RepID=A0A1X7A0W5_9RHOB|nr:hypothetical protein ROJ8625_03406 [Roseivivax jejudonensis]